MRNRKGKKRHPVVPIGRFERIYIRDGGTCWICGVRSTSDMLNKDHLIPRSLGGSDGMWNIRVSHPACNTQRDRMPPPLSLVLQYCTGPGMARRARKMYYQAYPHLGREGASRKGTTELSFSSGEAQNNGRAEPDFPAPLGHSRYPSAACASCKSWCGSCKACWCMAASNGHDVVQIGSNKVAMGIPTPS